MVAHFVMEEKDANKIWKFRRVMNKVFFKKLKSPKLPLNEAEEKLLEAAATVLTLEEQLCKKSTNATKT